MLERIANMLALSWALPFLKAGTGFAFSAIGAGIVWCSDDKAWAGAIVAFSMGAAVWVWTESLRTCVWAGIFAGMLAHVWVAGITTARDTLLSTPEGKIFLEGTEPDEAVKEVIQEHLQSD